MSLPGCLPVLERTLFATWALLDNTEKDTSVKLKAKRGECVAISSASPQTATNIHLNECIQREDEVWNLPVERSFGVQTVTEELGELFASQVEVERLQSELDDASINLMSIEKRVREEVEQSQEEAQKTMRMYYKNKIEKLTNDFDDQVKCRVEEIRKEFDVTMTRVTEKYEEKLAFVETMLNLNVQVPTSLSTAMAGVDFVGSKSVTSATFVGEQQKQMQLLQNYCIHQETALAVQRQEISRLEAELATMQHKSERVRNEAQVLIELSALEALNSEAQHADEDIAASKQIVLVYCEQTCAIETKLEAERTRYDELVTSFAGERDKLQTKLDMVQRGREQDIIDLTDKFEEREGKLREEIHLLEAVRSAQEANLEFLQNENVTLVSQDTHISRDISTTQNESRESQHRGSSVGRDYDVMGHKQQWKNRNNDKAKKKVSRLSVAKDKSSDTMSMKRTPRHSKLTFPDTHAFDGVRWSKNKSFQH